MARAKAKFTRAKPTLPPKQRFFLFCEGKSTEPGYFRAMQRFVGAVIEVMPIPAGSPKTIAEQAIGHAKREGLAKKSVKKRKFENTYQARDQVWAVIDRDEHEPFEEPIRSCEQNGVNVARSNPCFEIWLILHQEDFHRPDDRHQVCRHLRKLRPEYDPHGAKTCHWAELLANVEIAETRAANQLRQRERESAPFGAPSTTVGELTRAIREAAKRSAR